MKKFVSAVIAGAMIASMGATAFATQPTAANVTLDNLDSATMTDTNAKVKTATPDGDDTTIKADDNKAYFPVVAMVGPYGYYADDKVLFDATATEEVTGYKDYAAPIEFGDTAYYALIQAIPTVGTDGVSGAYHFADSYDGKKIGDTATFTGDTYYSVVTESETVSSIKIKSDWEEGKDLVKSISIVKKKVCNPNEKDDVATDFEYSGDDSDEAERPYASLEKLGLKQFGLEENDYAYFLAIKYNDSTSVNDDDVVGTITLSKSKDPAIDKYEFDIEVNVDWENSWRQDSEWKVTGDVDIKADTNYALKFDCDDVVTLTFDDDSYFEVDVSGQSKLLFNYTTDYISRIAAKYPYAELNFWNGNGAKFNRVGEFFLSCEDLTGNQFLYQVTSDGKLAEVPGAEWDDSDEGFYFNTRVLGSYVVSDMELDVVDNSSSNSSNSSNSSSDVVVSTPVISNPSTGAIA